MSWVFGMKMKLRISALALMSWISVTETTRADILPNNWTVNGLDTTGTIFSAGYFVAILYPGISLTQTVNQASIGPSWSGASRRQGTSTARSASPVSAIAYHPAPPVPISVSQQPP